MRRSCSNCRTNFDGTTETLCPVCRPYATEIGETQRNLQGRKPPPPFKGTVKKAPFIPAEADEGREYDITP